MNAGKIYIHMIESSLMILIYSKAAHDMAIPLAPIHAIALPTTDRTAAEDTDVLLDHLAEKEDIIIDALLLVSIKEEVVVEDVRVQVLVVLVVEDVVVDRPHCLFTTNLTIDIPREEEVEVVDPLLHLYLRKKEIEELCLSLN
jgi:hypothetical protein